MLRERVTAAAAHVELRDRARRSRPDSPPQPRQMVESREDPAFAEANTAARDAEAGQASRPAPPRPGQRVGPLHLGQHAAQRALPLRFGQEVQALPRRGGVRG